MSSPLLLRNKSWDWAASNFRPCPRSTTSMCQLPHSCEFLTRNTSPGISHLCDECFSLSMSVRPGLQISLGAAMVPFCITILLPYQHWVRHSINTIAFVVTASLLSSYIVSTSALLSNDIANSSYPPRSGVWESLEDQLALSLYSTWSSFSFFRLNVVVDTITTQ